MKTKTDRAIAIVVILLMMVSIVNTVFLRKANVIIANHKIEIQDAKQEVYEYLNTIAWDSTVSKNKQHVTGITRYYKCDAVKKEIEKHIK